MTTSTKNKKQFNTAPRRSKGMYVCRKCIYALTIFASALLAGCEVEPMEMRERALNDSVNNNKVIGIVADTSWKGIIPIEPKDVESEQIPPEEEQILSEEEEQLIWDLKWHLVVPGSKDTDSTNTN